MSQPIAPDPTPDAQRPTPESERPLIRVADMPHSQTPDSEEDEGEEIPLPTPYVSYALMGIISLIFVVMMWSSRGNLSGLIVNGEYSVADLFGQKNNALIRAGQYWRFLTPVFLHGSLLHLLSNGLSLLLLGAQLERIYGRRRYWIIYIISGIMGNVVSYLLTAEPSLGASGAIFGLVGAGLIFPIRFRSLLRKEVRDSLLTQLLIITAVNLGLGFSIAHVDNMAHMGGLVGGALCALFLIPDVLDERSANGLRNALLTVVATAILGLVLAAAGLQVQWARSALSAPTMTYASSSPDPYWTVRIPNTWTWNRKQQVWTSEEGAELAIADNVQSPELAQLVDSWIRMAPKNLTLHKVDGKTAIAVRQLARDQNQFHEAVVVEAYDRQLMFVLKHRGAASLPKTARDFERIMRSVRIVHPPTRADKPGSLPVPLP